MKKMLFALMISLAVNGLAQPPSTPKTIELKYLQGERAERAIKFVNDIMVGRVKIVWDSMLNQLMIGGGFPDQVAQAEALLRKFDVPEPKITRRTLDFTVYLVGAYNDEASARGGPMPPELDAVVKEMQSAFAYKKLSLLDTIPVRATESRGEGRLTEYSGILPREAVGTPLRYFYKVHIELPRLQDDGKTVSVGQFGFIVDVPSQTTGMKGGESGIRTDLSVREGQKVVLGKIRLNEHDNSDVFLVVTVKVL